MLDSSLPGMGEENPEAGLLFRREWGCGLGNQAASSQEKLEQAAGPLAASGPLSSASPEGRI